MKPICTSLRVESEIQIMQKYVQPIMSVAEWLS